MAGESGGGLALQSAGAILSGVAQYQEASANQQQAKWEAKQRKRNAKMIMATAGREASAERKQGDAIKSDAVAAMAAGGGGQDPSRLADIESVTRYNVLAALYEGKQAALTENTKADLAVNTAGSRKRVANMGVATSLFDGGSGLYKEWARYKNNRASKKLDVSYGMESKSFNQYKPFAEYE